MHPRSKSRTHGSDAPGAIALKAKVCVAYNVEEKFREASEMNETEWVVTIALAKNHKLD